MFADKYLKKNKEINYISEEENSKTGMRIVIPCYREPEILQTLDSLHRCKLPSYHVEVIVLVNHSEIAAEDIKTYNKQTCSEIEFWISANKRPGIDYFVVGPIALKKKWAGAGLARKKGMDEAVFRFNNTESKNGIIVSLDADTLVDENYLIEIAKYFHKNRKSVGATIAFEHQKTGLEAKQKEGILLYEKYLEYYKRSLEFTGYPYALFTIGSAFAVTAEAYVRRGGMNRRQAGEDFYFLQNLVQLGEVGEITTTKVYPSARLSDRVPFGTGPILRKWMSGDEDLTATYNFESFRALKTLFDIKDLFYKCTVEEFSRLLNRLPRCVSEFLHVDRFRDEIDDLNANCSNSSVFRKRFFQKFNAFKILKFLNFTHEKYFEKANLHEQVRSLNKEDQAECHNNHTSC